MQIHGKILDFICTASQRVQTNFFSQIHPITNFSYWMWNIIFLLSDLLHGANINTDFLTLGNNILLQSFNWPNLLHHVPTDKINASVCIRIRWIMKVIIHIQRMRILTSFVTSLVAYNTSTTVLHVIHLFYVWCLLHVLLSIQLV